MLGTLKWVLSGAMPKTKRKSLEYAKAHYHKKITEIEKDPVKMEAVRAKRRAYNAAARQRAKAAKSTKAEVPVTVTSPRTPKNYLNNRDLIAAVKASKANGAMSNELAAMLMTLTQRYARKPNWSQYTYNEDMQAYALIYLVQGWDKFNEAKYSNAFAYYTQIIHNAFIQYWKKEKSQSNVKDALAIDAGLDPSWNYQED